MSWFGLGGSSTPKEEPVSSYSDSSFSSLDEQPSTNYTSAVSSSGGTSVNDIIMEEQQKVLVQQAIAKITAIAWDKCSAAKPDTSLSSSEVTCMQNVASSYLDSSMWASRLQRPPDTVVARHRLEESAALTIQCAVRTFVAKRRLHSARQACLMLQQDRAASISIWRTCLQAAWSAIVTTQRPVAPAIRALFPLENDHHFALPSTSSYYTLAATLLQKHLHFRAAIRLARHVRQPSPLRHLITDAVVRTCTLMHHIRKHIGYHAALVVQCKMRCRWAVQRFASLLLEQSFLTGWADGDTDNDEMFWIKFGTSHFYAFEASGDRSHLEKTLAAFRRLLPKASDVERPAIANDGGIVQPIQPSTWLVLGLVYATALFYNQSFAPCLALCDAVLNVACTTSEPLDKEWGATAHVLASNVCFQTHAMDDCARHLAATLALGPLKTYSELALRYMLATVYSLLSKERDFVPIPSLAVEKVSTRSSLGDPQQPANAKVAIQDENNLENTSAVDPDETQSVTKMLLESNSIEGIVAVAAAATEPSPPPETEAERYARLSAVEYATLKWDDGAITTMKVTRGGNGDSTDNFYRNPNSPDAADRTLLGFLSKLPRAAGISLRQGLRRRSSSSRSESKYGVEWSKWEEWHLSDHAWLHAAHLWDQHSGYVFSSFLSSTCPAYLQFQATRAAHAAAAKTKHASSSKRGWSGAGGWHTSKRHSTGTTDGTPGEIRAPAGEACLILAKAARGIGKLTDSLILIQHAVAINPSYECIRRSWSAKASTLAAAMRRVQKLDRLWSRALAFDTYTARTRGRPQDEVLLLECIYRQHFHALATVDIHRRLVRAHVRAYCIDGFDLVHLNLAVRSMDALAATFERQHKSTFAVFPVPIVRKYGPSVPMPPPYAFRKEPSALLSNVVAPSFSKGTKGKKPKKRGVTSTATARDSTTSTDSQPKQKVLQKRQTLLPPTLQSTWPVEMLAEMAEVTYRSLQLPRAVDSLQVLARRIVTTPAYSHLYRLTLLRLAFLFARHLQFDLAIRTMTTLLDTVTARGTAAVVAAVPKWPVPMPFEFSATDVRFMRGAVHDMAAATATDSAASQQQSQANAWTDFAPLHAELVRQVQTLLRDEQAATDTVEFRATHVSGVVVTVGTCQGLHIPNILTSNVRVVVTMDHHRAKSNQLHTASTADPPSWETMQPNWNQQIVTIPASTKHSMVTVQVVNKVHLRDIPLGYMTLPLSTLFASSRVDIKPWRLLAPDTSPAHSNFTLHSSSRAAPTLEVGFQLTTVRPQFTNDVKEKRHIAFALGDFLNQPFVWHSFGARLMRLSDHFLARHFLVQALRRLPPPHDFRAIHMMLDVARCDLACRGNAANATKQQSSSVASAIEWLQKAHVAALMLEPRHPHVENAILDVMQQAMMHDSPFERKLTASLTQPLAADYVAAVSEHGQYFVNKDTGDCRMVVFNDSMKQRVLRLRRDMKDAAAADPDQWVAMFDDFHGRMFFVSQVHSMQSYTTPPKYIMQGDEMTVYSDPFVQLSLPGCKSRRTAIRKATLTPEWDEVFHMRYAWVDHELAMQRHQAVVASGHHRHNDDDDDDDVGHGVLEKVNMRRVTSLLEHNLALNDDKTNVDDYNSSEHDDTIGDDTGDEDDDGPMLTLTVLDYDTPTRGSVESSSDFLGQASVPLDALDHGNAISATLTLRDEDGYLSPRSRGTLEVTVQWISYSFPLRLKVAMMAVHAISRMDGLKRRLYLERLKSQVAPRKPKPTMSDDHRMLLELITATWHDALVKLADAIVMADQLQRLVLRLQEARKSHTNAEEEEHIERRLHAVIRDQFGGKRQAVESAMGIVAKGLRSFAKSTYDEVAQYVGSGTDAVLKEKVVLWYASIGYVAGQSTPRPDTVPPPAIETYDCIMQFVLTQKEMFVTWETCLRGVVEEGFVDGKWAFDMTKELAICRKIEATLRETPIEEPQLTREEEERIKQRQQVRAKKLDKQKKRTKK
ncbi:hypothetical protein DYB36_002810 [Aphanomyces astaci]|uniref:C2 domain-containing protein n=1 Tax=Aphanomyces astaci TaxID=112090 RepID=A0A396ZQ87_APHAT|nr:hypothetical protein DYB36_002810 [Aphanomyces astaci]